MKIFNTLLQSLNLINAEATKNGQASTKKDDSKPTTKKADGGKAGPPKSSTETNKEGTKPPTKKAPAKTDGSDTTKKQKKARNEPRFY